MLTSRCYGPLAVLVPLLAVPLLAGGSAPAPRAADTRVKTFIDYFLPTPPHGSNVAIMARPDGNFEFTQRDGRICFSDKGILGPYKAQGASVFPKGIPNLEDRNCPAKDIFFVIGGEG